MDGLGFGPEIAEKIKKGEPLWDESKKQKGEDDEEEEELDAYGNVKKDDNALSDE